MKDEIMKKNKKLIATRILSIFIAFVFIQSLFFKYSGAPETVYIFTTLNDWANATFGVNGLFLPPGIFNAYIIATAELIASVAILTGLFSKFKVLIPLGALMALGIITGAIGFHLFTPLGINVQDDGGALFFMACGVWFSSVGLLMIHGSLLFRLLKKAK